MMNLFECHICKKHYDIHEDLRIHLLFTHQFFMPECETNRHLVNWDQVRQRRKEKRMLRGNIKMRTNQWLVVRWLYFWDDVEGTDFGITWQRQKTNASCRKYYQKNKEQIRKRGKEYSKEYNKRPKVIAKRKEKYQQKKELILAKRKEKYQQNKEEILAKRRHDYAQKSGKGVN